MKQEAKQESPATVQKIKKDESVDNSEEKQSIDSMIGGYHEAPKYMKDNEHITDGYRINFNSPWKITKSLFMVHNESVNIWTHFLPTIIIMVGIISFALIVDKQSLSQELQQYHQRIVDSFDHYKHALDNLTLIQDVKHMKDKTQVQLEELHTNAIDSYTRFTVKINENMNSINEILEINVTGLKDSVRDNIKNNLKKFKDIKKDYERVIAPALINRLVSINNTYVNGLKQQIESLKLQIDSDDFKYVDGIHGQSPNPHHVSRWPIMVFLSSALICLICSTLFHLFYPMSSISYAVFSRLDYAGISLLIAGSTFPPLYYGMYCYLQVALVYEIFLVALAIGIFVLSVFEWMHRKQNASYKAFIYGGFGLFNIIPVTHLVVNDLFFNVGDNFSFTTSLPYYILLGASYLIGLYVYTVRCPQRHYPGKFNLCGSSHQIWHLFVIMGIIFTYLGALQNYEMRKIYQCPVTQ